MSDPTSSPRRRRVAAAGWLSFAAFALVMGAVEYLTARGQWAFGTYFLGLSGPATLAAYIAIQGLMLATAALGLWAVLSGDRYFGHRMWTAVFLCAAALADFLGARAAGWSTVGAVYMAGFALAALRTWHAILRRIARGTAPRYPMIGFPLLRWVLAFGETRQAFRLMVLDRLSPDAALAAVRGQVAPVVETADGVVDLSRVSKADAVRQAFSATGGYAPAPVMEWLTARGVSVDRSYVYDLARKEQTARRAELHAVTAAPAGAAKSSARRRRTSPAAAVTAEEAV